MDLTPGPRAETFRAELRAWQDINLPETVNRDPLANARRHYQQFKSWQRKLTEGDAAPFSHHYLRVRDGTIEAGPSEIMRNTIGTRVLALPKNL